MIKQRTKKIIRKTEMIVLLAVLLLVLFTVVLHYGRNGASDAEALAPCPNTEATPSLGDGTDGSESDGGGQAAEVKRGDALSSSPEGKSRVTEAPRDESAMERVLRLIQADPPGDPDEDYYIRVFLDQQMVGIFIDEGHGSYDLLLKAFPCCTGLVEGSTPAGMHRIGIKHKSGYMIDGSYGQYCSSYTQNMYFHGMPSYNNEPEAGVRWHEFNNLGHPASHGCIRLSCKDAKWIYDFVKEGTSVEILEKNLNYPQMPAEIDFIKMKEGGPSWDPTNPNHLNPYQQNPELLLP